MVLLFSQVDLATKVWACALCGVRNPFPAHYAGMTESNLPAELLPNITTIEYPLLRQSRGMPPVFLFVVDTCLGEEDAQALKDSLLQVLDLLPENALVGLITFGSTVRFKIHDVVPREVVTLILMCRKIDSSF